MAPAHPVPKETPDKKEEKEERLPDNFSGGW